MPMPKHWLLEDKYDLSPPTEVYALKIHKIGKPNNSKVFESNTTKIG